MAPAAGRGAPARRAPAIAALLLACAPIFSPALARAHQLDSASLSLCDGRRARGRCRTTCARRWFFPAPAA